MLPLADALEVTGGSDVLVQILLDLVRTASPRTVMAAIFGLTAIMGVLLPNIAAAVLVAPIAITAAKTLGISPYSLALRVLTAASATFFSPVSTPVITVVVAPGGYRFGDFVKTSLPLTVLVGIVTVMIAPIFFPY
ncbi:hypothetical protein Q5Y75_01550 [Ruegeria sp. 2205SS24-7]|nr:SLC13 family permease [Ruegeria sp. 2205SS24-7]MDP5215894.1 hypothetical protein [Ruegeria sp. 2205SS24-7]